jgi:hypothetical protein
VSERREQILAQMRALGGASYLQALEKESHPVGKTAGRR